MSDSYTLSVECSKCGNLIALIAPGAVKETVCRACHPVVAYRFPADCTDELVCADPECTARYADLMATVATGMTQADVEDWQNNRDGKIAYCAICSTELDGLAR